MSNDTWKTDPLCGVWVNEFTEESAKLFRERILELSHENKEAPIVVYIDSYGGQVDALATMINVLDSIPNQVVTVCEGKAMSCGAILLSHGDVRFCGEYSRVMIHEISTMNMGNIHEVIIDSNESKRLNEVMLGLLARNCGFKGYKEFRDKFKDYDGLKIYLPPKEAIQFGIVDHIGTPVINKQVSYVVSARTVTGNT